MQSIFGAGIDDKPTQKILLLLHVALYTEFRVQVPEMNLRELPREDLVP